VGHVTQAGGSMRPAGRGLKIPGLVGRVTFDTWKFASNFVQRILFW